MRRLRSFELLSLFVTIQASSSVQGPDVVLACARGKWWRSYRIHGEWVMISTMVIEISASGGKENEQKMMDEKGELRARMDVSVKRILMFERNEGQKEKSKKTKMERSEGKGDKEVG